MRTWGLVVADGEVRGDGGADVGKPLSRAVVGGAAQLGGALPDNLGEVAPLFEVGHVRVVLVIETLEKVDFAVVEKVGNDGRNVAGFNTGGNVLAVTTTTGLAVDR